jgi:hypothetical protein
MAAPNAVTIRTWFQELRLARAYGRAIARVCALAHTPLRAAKETKKGSESYGLAT